MKNQWFGDIKDYYKYGLLRLITKNANLTVGICWMLTENDGRKPNVRYLSHHEIWRHYDPYLYDFLRHLIIDYDIHDIVKIQNKRILPACQHYSAILKDDAESRQQYLNNFKRLMQACDLLFFDADNGMEVKSKPYGRNHSSEYLYWREVRELYESGYSLLIFQYHRRVKYEDFIKSLSKEFVANVGVKPQFFYRTTNATLLFLAQNKHQAIFQKLNKAIEANWSKQIQIIQAN